MCLHSGSGFDRFPDDLEHLIGNTIDTDRSEYSDTVPEGFLTNDDANHTKEEEEEQLARG